VDETEVLLFAASRAQHVRHLIQPVLNRGAIVICDRFMDSTTAYQGYARGLDLEFIQKLNLFALDGCRPNMTILLDILPEVGFKRAAERQETLFTEDRIESETTAFHERVREGFLRIAANEPNRIKIIAADRPEKVVHKEIMELITHAFGPF
jgi:dTMP kinase